jgi:squalene-hopene/tetraprenyl-beta-curcumene cyclase
VVFLLQSSAADGCWRDWDTQAGVSDEWVTAYAACVLAAGDDSAARAAAERAFELLCVRRPLLDGWGYNGNVPPDADSTIWVCRLARALNRLSDVAPAVQFLERCLQPDGGVSTYASSEGVRRSMHLPPGVSFRGWLASHACVTAAAAASLPQFGSRPEVRAYLRRAQNPDGHWEGYWWPDPEYATALAVEALRDHSDAEDTSAIEVASSWARKLPMSTSAFALACRIRILRCDDPEACRQLAAKLAELQSSDGSWSSSAQIRIPPPDFMHPESVWNWDYQRKDVYGIRLDQERVFTTATVLNALQLGLAGN